jgi:nucleoside-diphosphate-sugar epimerase
MNKKKLLVTGSAGWVGSNIVPLLSDDYEIIGWDKKDGADIFETERLAKELSGCFGVVHLAGLRGPDCDREEGVTHKSYHEVNYDGSVAVVKAMKKAKVKRLVFISSGAVYGTLHYPLGELPDKPVAMETPLGYIVQDFHWPIKDNSPYPNNLHPYAQCKLDTEEYFKTVAKKNDQIIVSLRVNGFDADPQTTPWSISFANAVLAIKASLLLKKSGFYWFNIANNPSRVDVSKAEKVLGYYG